jgi:hypothetical protein
MARMDLITQISGSWVEIRGIRLYQNFPFCVGLQRQTPSTSMSHIKCLKELSPIPNPNKSQEHSFISRESSLEMYGMARWDTAL